MRWMPSLNEQMINIFLAPTDDMDNLRRAYVINNKKEWR